MSRRPIMLDFEMPLLPIRELKFPPRKMKENRVYLVPGDLQVVDGKPRDWDPDTIYMLCPCGCGHRVVLSIADHYQISRAEHLGLTITPEVFVRACKTRFIVAHNMIYGKCPFPPQRTKNAPRKEIVLKFGKRESK